MAIQRIDLLSCGNFGQNTYKNVRLWCSRILSGGSIDVIVGVGENKRSYTLSAVVYAHYTLLKKALRFLAILGIVWET